MFIIGVCGRKGGSGKTTVAVHLAAELSARGRETVLIDCDPQGSAKHWAEPGALPMLVDYRPLDGRADVRAWSKAVRETKAECIVLDSPPHLDAALGAVIGLADVALIPCGPSGLDLTATAETIALIREIRQRRGSEKPSMAIIPSRVDMRTMSGRELGPVLADLGETVAPAIRARTGFSDAFNLGQWVGEFAAHTPAHMEIRVLADFVEAMEK